MRNGQDPTTAAAKVETSRLVAKTKSQVTGGCSVGEKQAVLQRYVGNVNSSLCDTINTNLDSIMDAVNSQTNDL